jgi:lipoprotein-releasing system permease protein
MFAALAVTLCTWMVIVVISVMGGFLETMTNAIHKLEADVTIDSGLGGFPYYQELLDDLHKLDEVGAAAAVVKSWGLLKIEPDYVKPVQVHGIRGSRYNDVIDFQSTLHWTADRRRQSALADVDLTEAGMTFKPPEGWGDRPGIVLGLEISPTNRRDEHGQYDFYNSIVADSKRRHVRLNIVNATREGTAKPVHRPMIVVNEYKSGVYEMDSSRVFVDFDFLQKTLEMEAFERSDEDGEPLRDANGDPIIEPARCNEIVIKAAQGVELDVLFDAVLNCSGDFYRRHPDLPITFGLATWQQRHETIINAVKNEKGLITFLFVVIGLVAFVMVATTFYNIVLEKTRDIGVLRALGASRSGVAGVFLGYGLAIGIVGSLLGFGAAVATVTNLNEIQDAIYSVTGWRMWDPRIYLFDRIPDKVSYDEAGWIMLGATLSSVIGALLPALVAARVNPIEALRYE